MTDLNQHLRDVADLAEANTRLCQVLMQSQSDLAARLDRVNSEDSRKMAESCSRLRGMVAALVLLNAYLLFRNDQDKAEILTSSVVAGQIALEAKALIGLAEAQHEKDTADQLKFNNLILEWMEKRK